VPKQKIVNLLPREDFDNTILGRIMKWALSSFRFIVIVVEFIVIAGFMFRFYLDVQINNLDDEINQKAALVDSKSSFEKEFRNVQKKIAVYSEIIKDDNKPSLFFNQTWESLPVDMQLVDFTKEADGINIQGATLNEASISLFVSNLESKDRLGEVDIVQIKTVEDSPLIEFTLKVSTNSI
jgi:Tfp pilus assembly protein PilN